MRVVAALAGAVCLALGPLATTAGAGPHGPTRTGATCLTSVVFGEPMLRERALVFRGAVSIACPPGVAFSAVLRSANACRLRSAGTSLAYELFADPAMQSAVVSCERIAIPLRGVGRALFVVYGRVSGPLDGSGNFRDSLLATVTTS